MTFSLHFYLCRPYRLPLISKAPCLISDIHHTRIRTASTLTKTISVSFPFLSNKLIGLLSLQNSIYRCFSVTLHCFIDYHSLISPKTLSRASIIRMHAASPSQFKLYFHISIFMPFANFPAEAHELLIYFVIFIWFSDFSNKLKRFSLSPCSLIDAIDWLHYHFIFPMPDD